MPPEPIIKDTTILAPGPVILESNLEKTRWFNKVSDTMPVYDGKKFAIPFISKSTQLWAESYEKNSFPIVNAGLPEPKYLLSPFHDHIINGGLFFNVQKDCILKSVVVYTDRLGKRIILLQDETMTTIDSVAFTLTPGMNILPLNFNLFQTQKKYYLTTSTSVNNSEFLSNSPWLYRSDVDFSYPISVKDVITIFYSGSGEEEYHYFYDWKIVQLNKDCSSKRIPVNIIVENTSTSTFKSSIGNKFYCHERKIIFTEHVSLEYIALMDSRGAEIFSEKNYNGNVIDLGQIPSGLYFIQYKLMHSNFQMHGKLFVE